MQSRLPARGFTLVELLVSVVILSIGLLGLAGLQNVGVAASYSALQRSQASWLASEMSDLLRANLPAAARAPTTLPLPSRPEIARRFPAAVVRNSISANGAIRSARRWADQAAARCGCSAAASCTAWRSLSVGTTVVREVGGPAMANAGKPLPIAPPSDMDATAQCGLSLVELLIAMALSLLLMAGVIEVLLSSKQTYHASLALAELQESGRFAFDILAQDLRTAGSSVLARPAW